MAHTRDQIIADIENYIRDNGANFGNWYVGIAADPQDRLSNGHGVTEDDVSISRLATSSTVAREVENYFIYLMSTQGGDGGGDDRSTSVYAYKIKSHTRQ